ncbi:MAG: hypothetical protein KF889_06400 [Alphaproteobacteria bacterium]|nr:hypothetical protein [Alphaproteobacteria bacterium]MCW5740449.1 hypothetical protein [Alphaproteobacteria bacterium]
MDDVSEWVFAILATAMALIGLVLWARAIDFPMGFFGFGLVVFGVAFDFFLVKRHFDRGEAGR